MSWFPAFNVPDRQTLGLPVPVNADGLIVAAATIGYVTVTVGVTMVTVPLEVVPGAV